MKLKEGTKDIYERLTCFWNFLDHMRYPSRLNTVLVRCYSMLGRSKTPFLVFCTFRRFQQMSRLGILFCQVGSLHTLRWPWFPGLRYFHYRCVLLNSLWAMCYQSSPWTPFLKIDFLFKDASEGIEWFCYFEMYIQNLYFWVENIFAIFLDWRKSIKCWAWFYIYWAWFYIYLATILVSGFLWFVYLSQAWIAWITVLN